MGVGQYWTDGLNPLKVGKRAYHCTKITSGCAHCWAEMVNINHCGGCRYDNRDVKYWLDDKTLQKPFHWTRKPRTIFVCHLCDIFHDLVPFEFVDEILAVAALTDRQRYLFSTKREKNQLSYFTEDRRDSIISIIDDKYSDKENAAEIADAIWDTKYLSWPPQNCIFGVSMENQKAAEVRLPDLMALRTQLDFDNIWLWGSVEPQLGPIDFEPLFNHLGAPDWIVNGGESGDKCRVMHRDWPRFVRDTCNKFNVSYYFKQWGGFNPADMGRNLDGRIWDELPRMLQKDNI